MIISDSKDKFPPCGEPCGRDLPQCPEGKRCQLKKIRCHMTCMGGSISGIVKTVFPRLRFPYSQYSCN